MHWTDNSRTSKICTYYNLCPKISSSFKISRLLIVFCFYFHLLYSSAEKLRSLFDEQNDRSTFFREEFDLDLTDDNAYAKINVPDFQDGRVGRFLHDFKGNQTAIIDESTKRCFVMPLDRNAILPPKSLADVILKMYTGYYDINIKQIQKSMRVIPDELTDLSTISPNIQMACESMSIYRLEKMVDGGKLLILFYRTPFALFNTSTFFVIECFFLSIFTVVKRSADPADRKEFTEFSGNYVTYRIENMSSLNRNN